MKYKKGDIVRLYGTGEESYEKLFIMDVWEVEGSDDYTKYIGITECERLIQFYNHNKIELIPSRIRLT